MHEIKRKHFELTHPGKEFPEFVTLKDAEARRLRDAIAERVGCHSDDGLQLVTMLASRSVPVNTRADSGDFSLEGILWQLQISSEQFVYINWYRFDDIDRIALKDLSAHFFDIWYPSSDDIDVFDETLRWVLTIDHAAEVSVTRLGTRHPQC